MTGAWIASIALAAALFFYIFFLAPDPVAAPMKSRLAFLLERKDVVYENLRDLNFEYSAGKIPDADYESLRASLEHEAAAILAEIERLERQEEVRA